VESQSATHPGILHPAAHSRTGQAPVPFLRLDARVIAKSIFPFELPFEFNKSSISQGILAIALIQHDLE